MADTKQLTTKPPRYFLRRLAALLIDLLIFTILATFVVGAVAMAFPSLRQAVPSSFFSARICSTDNTDLPVFAEIERNWPGDETGATKPVLDRRYCTVDSFYLPQKRLALVTEQQVNDEDGQTYVRSVSVQLDDNNAPIFPSPLTARLISMIEILAFPGALALSTIFLGWTPGKRAMSLVVTRDPLTKNPPPLSPAQALTREYLKFWPVWVYAIISLIISREAAPITSIADATAALQVLSAGPRAVADVLVLNAATLLLLFVWWIWPFALWRGRALYDGFMRCYVVLRN